MIKLKFSLCCCCALSVLAPLAAQAQSAKPAEPSAEVAEVVITARKTTENLQHAPISVTAISADLIRGAGIKDPTDLQSRMPSVEFQTATSVPGVFIRGIGTYNLQAGVDAAVAYSIDDIYLARPQAFPPVLVDIAQVEVVRGPQGTLYGRNSNGGAISFTTRKPALGAIDAAASVTTGNYDALGTEAMFNAPLGQKAAVRIAFGSNRHDGYYTNGYNNADDWVGRVRLLAQPTDKLELVATFDRSRIRNDGSTYDVCPPRSAYPLCATVPWKPWSGLDGRDPTDFTRIDTWAAYGEANLKLDWATVTALTGFRRNDWLTQQTFLQVGTSAGFTQGQLSRLFTQELRIASNAGSRVQWLLGGFYSRETGPSTEAFEFAGSTYFTSNPQLESESKAVFGQVTYPVTEAFRVTGGLRYTDEHKSATGPIEIIQATTTTLPIDNETQVRKVTWKGGLEYDLTPQSLLYGSVSTGFKSGGVNQVPDNPIFAKTYAPETITAYQLGAKNRFFSGRLQVNAEGFYYDYKNFQTLQVQIDTTGALPGFFLQTANSQKAMVYGAEMEISLALSPLDKLSVDGTWLHSRFDRFLVGGIDLSGKKIQASPPYSLSASYEHIFELKRGGAIVFDADSRLVGGHYMDNSNVPGSYQPAYTRSGAGLTYRDAAGRWSASVFIRNIEGNAQIMTYTPSLLTAEDLVTHYPPRVFGGSIRWTL